MLNHYPYRQALMVAAVMFFGASIGAAQATKATAKAKAGNSQGRFKVSAPDLESKGRITAAHVYNGMGCSGQNISPTLNWSNPPAGTKSFAVTAYDPDAPTGSGWWHWVMYNIPPTASGLTAGAGTAGDPARAAPARRNQGIQRAVSTGGRQAAPLSFHGFRAQGR